jgi:hypothetical protein
LRAGTGKMGKYVISVKDSLVVLLVFNVVYGGVGVGVGRG